ncbi:hypothetical protein T11_4289 [Trichinella zimbabwensis]|uniref:Uncharacterized protein n=1 Tax=Trichinella zimbabwensis TaxID=268475 RepID=A0A0V1GC35_9BILA|nr:hypothetical protein T11_4289 [Trichinella zimbabwensis]
MDGKQLLIPLWYNLESTIYAQDSLTGICRSRRCLGSFGYRFARWLYIVDFTRLKSGKWPDVDGWADAAEASSS